MYDKSELDYKIIGKRIKKARKDNGITQEKLSEKMDVSVAYLSRIERGNLKINLKRLSEISKILNISLTYLLTGTQYETKEYLIKEFAQILKNCNTKQQKLIFDIAELILNVEI